jgi:hypothetical protein
MKRPNHFVRRDPPLSDNKQLPRRLQLEVGRTVYQKMREGFRGDVYDCPAPLTPSASIDEVARAVQQIFKVFTSKGYALNARVLDIEAQGGSGYSWTTRVEGGANLWGMQALRARRALVTDSFDAFAVQGFLDASGWDASFKVQDVGGLYVEQAWAVKPRVLAA